MISALVSRDNRPGLVVKAFTRVTELAAMGAGSQRLPVGLARELRLDFFLAAFAGMEGLLRHDMQRRVASSLSDGLTARLKLLRRKTPKGEFVTLEAILDVWKEATSRPALLGGFRQFKGARDWLSHGRLGPEPKARRTDPERLMVVLREIAGAIPEWPSPLQAAAASLML